MNWYKEFIVEHHLFNAPGRVNDPELLYPPFREKVRRLITIAWESGLNVGLFETYRSNKRQLKLFLQRRSKLRRCGMHHYGVAADIVFLTTGGGWTWSPERGGMETHSAEPWMRLGQIGKDLGLVWGGDWKQFVDCPHFQLVPVAGQDGVRRGEYPPAWKDTFNGYRAAEDRAKILAARREIVRHLSPIYTAAMGHAELSNETMAKLNGFRHAPELGKIKLEE